MKNECIQAVTDAIGRSLSAQELADIETRVRAALPVARKSLLDQGQAVTQQSMLQEAARIAAAQIDGEVQLKRLRVARTIEAHDRIDRYLSSWQGDKLDAFRRLIAFDGDARNRALSIESQARAIRDEAVGQMRETLEASDAKWFGLVENMNGLRLLLREMMGEDTGNPAAKAGAKAWAETTERLRNRFNRAGGAIGKLEDWGLPHHHSQVKVAKTGADAWISDVLPLLNRARYVNADGTLMSDEQLQAVLREAWRTISQGGINKIEPGRPSGNGMRANWGAESRVLHFKDADSWIGYQLKYGEKGFYDVMVGHVDQMARNIALVETFGPNPNHTFAYFRDLLLQQAAEADPARAGRLQEQAVKIENLYNFVAGRTLPVANERIARGFDHVRSWLTASRLGSAVISSIPDEATMHLTALVNRLPEMQLFRNELATLNPANKTELRLAQRAGLAVETMISELNRFGQDALGASFSSKMATVTIRASGLSAITAARKRAFGVTMMDAIGRLVQTKGFQDLDPADHRILLSKGITEADWKVWKLADLENWEGRNTTMLTPESIRRIPDAAILKAFGQDANAAAIKDQAVTRLLGAVLEEVDMAVITPGAAERALMGAGLQRGTWKGELTRSFFLFKSFPISMIYRHWSRGMGMETAGGKALYLAALFASTTILGAVAQQIVEVINGRDPKNMNVFDDPDKALRFWGQAMLKGGSLGIYGDFLFSENTQYGGGPIATLAGPVAGLAEDLIGLTQGNLIQAAQGKETHAGAELVKFVKANTPGASLWYTKAALDHLIFQQLQEYASPGYLASVRRRAQREFGQAYWWTPGDIAPERAPDLGAAIGE